MTSFEEPLVFSWMVDFLFVDEIKAENDLIKIIGSVLSLQSQSYIECCVRDSSGILFCPDKAKKI